MKLGLYLVKLVLIALLLSSLLYAQDKVDSLLISLQAYPDLKKIDALNDLCWKYRDIDPALSVKAAERAIIYCEKENDKKNKSKALGYLSVIYRDHGEYEKALGFCSRSLELAQSIYDLPQTGYGYNNIATIYRLMGNYPLALEYGYKGLKIFEELNDNTGYAFCAYNIGITYLRQKYFKKAFEYLDATAKIRKKIGDVDGEAKALSRIAEIYVEIKEFHKALDMYHLVQDMYKGINDSKSILTVWMGTAEVYEAENDLQSALIERQKALKLSQKFSDVDGVVRNSGMIGVLLGRLGNYEEGEKYLQSAFKLAEQVNSSFLKMNSINYLAQFYEAKEDFPRAYHFIKMYNNFRDSIQQKESSTSISEVEAAYVTNKKEKEKELLAIDLKNQKTLVGISLTAILIFIGVSAVIVLLYNTKRKTNNRLRELNATKDRFFSIIAHDLRSPVANQFHLASLLSEEFLVLNDEEKLEIVKTIKKSGKHTIQLLDNLLMWAGSQTGRMEFSPSKIYIDEIIKAAFGLLEEQARRKNISLIHNLTSEVVAFADEEMIKTVVRNLVSNAIKFTASGGTVSVIVKDDGKFRIISVVDNGVGILKKNLDKLFKVDSVFSEPGTAGEKGSGLGLVICKEFVKKNGGKIWVESEPEKGSTFTFTLPIFT